MEIMKHGMRKVSFMTKGIPDGYYVQISFDLKDGEILGKYLEGEPNNDWKPYQSNHIVAVKNTATHMTEKEILDAVDLSLRLHLAIIEAMK